MHRDQGSGAATARRLVVQEIQIGQAAQRTTNGALMGPRRAQVHKLAEPNPVVPDALPTRKQRDDRLEHLPDRSGDAGLSAGLSHPQRHAVSGVVIDPGPQLDNVGETARSCFCITFFVTNVRGARRRIRA